jgi:hypothetical protein
MHLMCRFCVIRLVVICTMLPPVATYALVTAIPGT